jgi:hypothetical protein
MAIPSQLKQQEQVYQLSEAVMPIYLQRYDGDFTGKYTYPNESAKPKKWHSLEEIFCYPYVFPDGRKTFIRGRRDGVFVDAKNRFWVMDTKCRSYIDHEEILDTMPLDFQQMLYLWITHEEMVQKKLKPYWPQGTVMNVIRRPQQRQKKDETERQLYDRIAQEYAANINTQNPDDMKYIRYQMEVKPQEIENWKKKQLDPIMTDIREWWEGTRQHYARTKHLVSKYGRAGMYAPIVHGDFSNCYKRKSVFPELAI